MWFSEDSIINIHDRDYIFSITNKKQILPMEVYVYRRSKGKAEIIGKNLAENMKVICTKDKESFFLGQTIKLGKLVK